VISTDVISHEEKNPSYISGIGWNTLSPRSIYRFFVDWKSFFDCDKAIYISSSFDQSRNAMRDIRVGIALERIWIAAVPGMTN
jgi:hypothetical protein